MRKIKSSDEVIVIAGRCKGQRGKVLRIIEEGKKALVEGIQFVTKHVKANPQKNEQGGLVKKEAPIHISNLAVYNPATGKGDRVRIKTLDDGRRVRVFASNGEVIDVRG